MQRSLVAPTLALALAASALPADARVQRVDIEQAPSGAIAEIDVIQTEGSDGQLRYTHVDGESMTFPTQISGKCKAGYLILNAQLTTRSACSRGGKNLFTKEVCEVPTAAPGQPAEIHSEDVPFTDGNRTFGERAFFFEVPFEKFERFLSDIIEYGNIDVDERATNAFEEERIRDQTWTSWRKFRVSFELECKRAIFYTGLDGWVEGDEEEFDLRVNYVGKGKRDDFELETDPTPYAATSDLLLRQGVRSADLLALEGLDEGACQLDLSGTIQTTAPMPVTYRLVDDKGVRSPLYEVAVDQTLTAYIHHQIDLSDLEPEQMGLTAEEGAVSIGTSFTGQDTELLQGFYRIEVVSPNAVSSDEASYSMEPCVAPLPESSAHRRETGFATLR